MGKGSLREHRKGSIKRRDRTISAPKRHDSMKAYRHRSERTAMRATLRNGGEW